MFPIINCAWTLEGSDQLPLFFCLHQSYILEARKDHFGHSVYISHLREFYYEIHNEAMISG